MIGAAIVAMGIMASAIQWGWQKTPDGGHEYIVQVEPQLTDIDSFRKFGFTSDIPPGLRDIRRIRIVVGSDPLPNEGDIPPAEAAPVKPRPTTAQSLPTAPATLPPGVSAEPLKAAQSGDSPSAKVALADGHQPADAAAIGGDSSGEKTPRAVAHSTHRSPSDDRDTEKSAPASSAPSSTTPPRPWLTLLAVASGLIVSLSGNVFLGWVHWGTRNQYRALVSQLRAQR